MLYYEVEIFLKDPERRKKNETACFERLLVNAEKK